jgi:hypothetical protein
MTDPNVNPNGQVPGQQADANPTEPLNAMTGEAGTAANNAPTQALAAGEQPTQAFTPVEQPTQAFTPAEQPTQPFAPVNQPVPPTQALPPVTPAAAPAPAPAAPNSCFASMFVRQVRQCFSAVWADGFPRCRHRFPVM